MSSPALTRLRKEYQRLKKEPVPFIQIAPLDSNLLDCHYVISGPPESVYEEGTYHGLVRFPPDYPFRPPTILMYTPSGRFETNTRLCLSMSDFHPETWNPMWSISSILNGLLSFMLENTPTTGYIETTDDIKRQLATESMSYNLKNSTFVKLFT